MVSCAAALLAPAGLAQQMGRPAPGTEQQAQQQTQQLAPPPTQTLAVAPGSNTVVPLSLQNASLVQVVDLLAQHLKLNYIIDPKVRGNVFLNSYGEVKDLDPKALLDTVLRINGAGMVKVGNIWRIVQLSDMPHQPMTPETAGKDVNADDQVVLNLLFLKYTTVDELVKVLKEFVGENAVLVPYAPANLLFIQDNRRSMRRTMELVSLFDSDQFANQRVHLFEVKNGKPSDIAKELDNVMKSIALNEKNAPVKFLPVDRINLLIGVAPNPGVFDTVEGWLRKLDVPLKVTAGAVDNYVYSLRYQRAECLAMSLMMLYGSLNGIGMGGMNGMYGMGGMGMGMGMGGYGMGGGGGLSTNVQGNTGLGASFGGGCGGMGGMGGMGMGGMGMGGFGMGGYGMGGYGMGGFGMGGYGGAPQFGTAPLMTGNAPSGMAGASADQTGGYLAPGSANSSAARMPRIVPNMTNNSLLIQATPQEYQSITKLLRELDVPPRQILLEARIYEVSLTGAFSSGVAAYLQQRSGSTHQVLASLVNAATNVSAGMLIGKSRELMAALQLQENATKAKVISAPSLIATDGIAASINVGNEVPVLTSTVPSSVQSGGNTQFAQTIGNRNTGVTLNVMAQINPSGIVTLIINQEVSAPQPPSAGGIQSPSFSKRTVQTQITMQNGDTIAIGGIINESESSATTGIPVLNRIPYLGAVFGSKSVSKDRTELIVFMTPHVIFDNTDLIDASDELKGRLRKLRKIVRE